MQRLGQHFLKNKEIITKIVNTLHIKSGDIIIEIGPGHGELTEQLVTRIIAVEKDRQLAHYLKKKFENKKNIEIIDGDILKLLPSLVADYLLPVTNYKVVGNIPYYITGHLLRILSELEHKPETITLLIQKEVAERIVAEPPSMNLLAAVTQSWAEPKIIAHVRRKEFFPPPQVDSAVITLSPKPHSLNPRYFAFLRTLFKQPRKTIVNNLMTDDEFQMTKGELTQKLQEINIDPGARPQNLSLTEIQNLFAALYN
jgi:16S rRNA (adenine1518-N6/adenine1519-N6)-dimethyltransferase